MIIGISGFAGTGGGDGAGTRRRFTRSNAQEIRHSNKLIERHATPMMTNADEDDFCVS